MVNKEYHSRLSQNLLKNQSLGMGLTEGERALIGGPE